MSLESTIGWLGGLFVLVTFAIIFYGIGRGIRRPAGRTHGQVEGILRSPLFYFLSSGIFIALSILGWISLPWRFSPQARIWMLAIGSLLFFPGVGLALWGRLALGRNYFVSTGLGAQVFAGQQLVTHGPYAIIRHPMYVGLILAAMGSLLIYVTWTTLVFACLAPLVLLRAVREEAVLAEEFGTQWQSYRRRVPALLPWTKKNLGS